MLGYGVFNLGVAVLLGRVMQALAFFSLAYWLTSEQMGVVALLTAMFVGLFSLTNLGFDRYLVYSEHVSEKLDSEVHAIWILQLGRGILIILISLASGYFIDNLTSFGVDITYHLSGIGLALFIYNLANPYVVFKERSRDFNVVAKLKAASVGLGALSMVLLVQVFKDPWVYVIGQIINTAIHTLLSYHYSDKLPKVLFDKKIMSDVWTYCKHFLIISTVSFVAVQFENFYLAFLFGPAVLGTYFTWARVVSFPREIVTQLLEKVMFSQGSFQRRLGEDVGSAQLLGLGLSFFLVLPVYFFLWNHSEWVMEITLGSRWNTFVWAVPYFILASVLMVFDATISPFILVNRPDLSSIIRPIEVVIAISLMIVLGNMYGIAGILYATLSSLIASTLIRIFLFYKRIYLKPPLRHLFMMVKVMFCVCMPLILIEAIYWEGESEHPQLAYFLCYLGYYFMGMLFIFKKKIIPMTPSLNKPVD